MRVFVAVDAVVFLVKKCGRIKKKTSVNNIQGLISVSENHETERDKVL